MNPRREPILWIQLIAIGVIPLEIILLRLILAGAEHGPLLTLERLIIWCIGVLLPTLIFLDRPADWTSIILFRSSIKGRSKIQLSINSLQKGKIPKILTLIGAILIYFLFICIDSSALIIHNLSPLQESSRVTTLTSSLPLLIIITWQWHQLTQSIWLLTQPENTFQSAKNFTEDQLKKERLCLGLGILNLPQFNEVSLTSSFSIKEKQGPKQNNSSDLNS